ncbi:MAG: hypothetical protein V1682_05055 [Candidatus Omnitrophota bacterium]
MNSMNKGVRKKSVKREAYLVKRVKKAVKRPKKIVSAKRKALGGISPKAKPLAESAKKAAKRVKSPENKLEKIGKVTHYFPHVNAAAVLVSKGGIAVGDKIYIKGHTTDFKENVRSIQLDHVSIEKGKKGQEIGLFVKSRVRIGDIIYRI